MGEWISSAVSGSSSGAAAIPAAFLLGLLGAVSSCCNAPLVAAVAGYAGSLATRPARRDLIIAGLCFMLGTAVALAALGAVTGFVGQRAGAELGRYWRAAGGLLIVAFGLASLGLLPWRLPRLAARLPLPRAGAAPAAIYGLAVGGTSTACAMGCNPLLPAVVAAAVLKSTPAFAAVLLAAFALGYSLPLAAGLVGLSLGLGRLGGAAARALPVVRGALGAAMIVVGFYLLAQG